MVKQPFHIHFQVLSLDFNCRFQGGSLDIDATFGDSAYIPDMKHLPMRRNIAIISQELAKNLDYLISDRSVHFSLFTCVWENFIIKSNFKPFYRFAMTTGITLNDIGEAARRFRESSGLAPRVSDLERNRSDDYDQELPHPTKDCPVSFVEPLYELIWLIVVSILVLLQIVDYVRRKVFGCLTRHEQKEVSKPL